MITKSQHNLVNIISNFHENLHKMPTCQLCCTIRTVEHFIMV